jgi:hypothetical protein
MQVRFVEGEDDLRKTDVIAVPVLFRVGKDNDVIFGKLVHSLGYYTKCI